MAVRVPMYLNGTSLQEMSAAMVTSIVTRTADEFISNPSVALSVVASGGSLGSISDTRLQAGAAITGRVSTPATEAETAEPTTVTVSYDRIDEAIAVAAAPVDTSNLAFPLYWTGSALQAMSLTDMRDTFFYPAITNLTAANALYTISTSTSVSGYTLVSTTPVFTDTRADTSLYAAADIPEALDQPLTVNNYYLHKKNGTTTAITSPVYGTSTGAQEFTTANFASILQTGIRDVAANIAGYKIRFNWNGAGTNTGSVSNTYLAGGSGNYQTWNMYDSYVTGVGTPNRDDYRAQEFPDGTATTTLNYLRVGTV